MFLLVVAGVTSVSKEAMPASLPVAPNEDDPRDALEPRQLQPTGNSGMFGEGVWTEELPPGAVAWGVGLLALAGIGAPLAHRRWSANTGAAETSRVLPRVPRWMMTSRGLERTLRSRLRSEPAKGPAALELAAFLLGRGRDDEGLYYLDVAVREDQASLLSFLGEPKYQRLRSSLRVYEYLSKLKARIDENSLQGYA